MVAAAIGTAASTPAAAILAIVQVIDLSLQGIRIQGILPPDCSTD
jgi:hypothetical protein